jgi:hypothetical protein
MLVQEDGRIALSDFGLAKTVGDWPAITTMTATAGLQVRFVYNWGCWYYMYSRLRRAATAVAAAEHVWRLGLLTAFSARLSWHSLRSLTGLFEHKQPKC